MSLRTTQGRLMLDVSRTISGRRAAGWLLTLLIVASTLTTGWHYLTDVLGGILLAVATVRIARRLLPGSPVCNPECNPER